MDTEMFDTGKEAGIITETSQNKSKRRADGR